MNNIFQLKNFQSQKLPTKFYQGLSALLHDLGIDGNDVVEDFISHYVKHAYEKTKTKSSVYLSTGFSRHIVKKYLNQANVNHKQKKRNLYYDLLINELKKLSTKHENGLIPIYGKFGSYTAAFDNTKPLDNIITSKSMLDNIITMGLVDKIDSNIRFLTSLQTKSLLDADSIINMLADLMNRISKTIQHNIKAKSTDETLFQMTYLSNSISPTNRRKLTDGLRELARRHFREYQQLIDSYEEKDYSQSEIEDLNNEIGISTFIFNNDNEV
ncbi:MAG: hypothetical protein L3J83_02805 [Proteobacteria bacterium]|nr:hypothetical protein [Pseudomonadota bacterium]